MRWSIVGTMNVWDTRCCSTACSQAPAVNRGSITTVRPDRRLTSSPSVPPMWKMGADIMSTTGGASGSMGAA